MRLIPKKTTAMVVRWSRTYASSVRDLTVGGAELEETQSLRTLGVTLASRLTLETHLRGVVSKIVRSPSVVHQARKLFDCSRVLKSCSKHLFCKAWSIVPPCGCPLWSLIWICWTMLFAVRKDYVKVYFVVWGTEEG